MRVRSRPLPSVLARLLPIVLAVSLLAAACLPATPEVVKIGLVAPFEGRYREIGSDVIPAVRLAIHEWAALNSGRGGRALAFELVSYDDEGDPLQAVEQARKLASDPDVEIVIGHWLDSTSQAALPVYTAADLRLITWITLPVDFPNAVLNLAPSQTSLQGAAERWLRQAEPGMLLLSGTGDVQEAVTMLERAPRDQPVIGAPVFGLAQFGALAGEQADGVYYVTGNALPADNVDLAGLDVERFVQGFEENSLGSPPGPLAASAYVAAWVAMTEVAAAHGYPLPELPVAPLEFDEAGRRVSAPIYLYRWQGGERVFAEQVR
ncbi:MAG TPA: ABC transporter substrate-binding protein [Aggregatilineales bacterium]|nr:ABC transporter substrate-binding protein [Aggregatilineales bacterium]